MTTADEAWADLRKTIKLNTLAAHLGISRAAVSAWPRVPEDRLDAVATYLRVDPYRLRPDIVDPWSLLERKHK